ncbi:hypothetical protein V3481_008338 [Fusarium oxysporum f. sp. vasinfectum]
MMTRTDPSSDCITQSSDYRSHGDLFGGSNNPKLDSEHEIRKFIHDEVIGRTLEAVETFQLFRLFLPAIRGPALRLSSDGRAPRSWPGNPGAGHRACGGPLAWAKNAIFQE